MTMITELNQSQANGVTYAASHILRRIKARAWSLKAARLNISTADKADLGVMSHFELLAEGRAIVFACITDRRESTIENLDALRIAAADHAHKLYSADRWFNVRVANVEDWIEKHHPTEKISDAEIRAAIREIGDNGDGTCSQYVTHILNKRAPAKTEESENEELNRDYLNDHGVQLPSYTGAGIYNGYKSACAKCDDLKEKIEIERRAMITAESDRDNVKALNHKAQLDSFMLQYGAALARREIIGNAVAFNIPQGDKEYRVTWAIDIYATSYENAAKEAARSYFREGLECSPDSAAVFDVLRRDRGWEDKSPIVVDLNKLNAGDWE
ncbi:hypothetical protein JT354_gp05 [Serratia phage JS26]|uniref:Uncharacterized protein n=1 Tax=Serratia phage JS26 TaxID=2315217 RepID=A0A5Q2F9J3_9CAUD|nr:hypothetical protein JT354_gp05 [Serratia phage JS26]QGF20880.1 hypothetical protein [Serratia phage JS26]